MKEQMKKLYEEQKKGKIKAVLISLLVCFWMTGIVSIFLGNPFPHQEKILFLEMTQSGWIQTHGCLAVLCIALGASAGMGNAICKILREFRRFDGVLLEKCDTKEYLEMMEFAVAYGKKLNFTSLRYHRLDDMIQSVGIDKCKLCTYCWDGQE